MLRADSYEALEGVLPFLCRARLEDEGYAFLQQEVAHRGEPPLWLMRAKPSGAWVGCQYAIRQAKPSLRRGKLPQQSTAGYGDYGAAQILHPDLDVWRDRMSPGS